MPHSVFGWSYPPGCSGPPEYPDPAPQSLEVWGILEGAGVDESVIETVIEIVDGLAEKAANCPECARQRREAEAHNMRALLKCEETEDKFAERDSAPLVKPQSEATVYDNWKIQQEIMNTTEILMTDPTTDTDEECKYWTERRTERRRHEEETKARAATDLERLIADSIQVVNARRAAEEAIFHSIVKETIGLILSHIPEPLWPYVRYAEGRPNNHQLETRSWRPTFLRIAGAPWLADFGLSVGEDDDGVMHIWHISGADGATYGPDQWMEAIVAAVAVFQGREGKQR